MPRLFLLVSLLVLSGTTQACRLAGLVAPGRQEEVAEVFARVHTSVVTLRTVSRGPTVESGGAAVELDGNGSGVLVGAGGDVLTAAHVVQGAERIEAVFFDGRALPARVVSSDPITDIALVRIEDPLPEGVLPATLGDSRTTRVGQRVFVVGAPLGISHTLTVGYVSARRIAPSLVDPEVGVEVIQTDAAINPGNSGGPLFDLGGRVIGIVSYISSRSGGNEGLGFAVSIDTCSRRLMRLPPFYSGVEFLPVRGRFAQLLNLPPGTSGYLVQRVVQGSAAARLGIRGGEVPAVIDGLPLLLGGDLLLSLDGIRFGGPDYREALATHFASLAPGAEVELVLLRAGERLTLRAPFTAGP